MEQYVALIWNNYDVYDRHFIRSNKEEKELFIKRVRNCYKDDRYIIDFHILGKYID